MKRQQFLSWIQAAVVVELPATQKAILLGLVIHVNDAGECWPSIRRLMQVTNLGRRTVINGINEIAKLGIIEKVARWSRDGSQLSNTYRLVAQGGADLAGGAKRQHAGVSSDDTGGCRETTLGGCSEPHPEQPFEQPEEQPGEQGGGGGGGQEDYLKASTKRAEALRLKWNEVPGVRACSSISGNRIKAYRAREKEAFFREHMDEALAKIPSLSFCMGDNSRGWIANLDWFLRPDTVPRILEGFYSDDKPDRPKKARSLEELLFE